MSYSLRLITEPAAEPVTVTEAKAHLVVEHSTDDSMIGVLITAARKHVEARTQRALVRQKWRIYLDHFCDVIDLHKQPVLSIDSVNYVDGDGVNQVVGGAASPNNPSAFYSLDLANGYVRKAYGATWPTPRYQAQSVWVDFWTGYASTVSSPNTVVPADLRVAILLLIGHLYEHREQSTDLETYGNPAFDLLIQPYWLPSE